MAKLVELETVENLNFLPDSGYVNTTLTENDGKLLELCKKSDGSIATLAIVSGGGTANYYKCASVVNEKNAPFLQQFSSDKSYKLTRHSDMDYELHYAVDDGTLEFWLYVYSYIRDDGEICYCENIANNPRDAYLIYPYRTNYSLRSGYYLYADFEYTLGSLGYRDIQEWSGNKAILTDGVYSFEENVTSGLTYGTGFTPVVGTVYDVEALMSCNLYLGGYQWIRFQINNIRNGYGYAQAAEFVLFDASGNEISCSELGLVKTSSNTTQVGGGSIASMFDGVKNDLYNVWCFEFFAGGYTEGEFRSKINLAKYPSYGWYTAGDLPERDPVSWSVYVSRNGTDWEMVSNISEYPTTDRFALAGKWSFDKVD